MNNFGLLCATGAAFTWGLVYVLDQKILSESSPFAYLFINSLITAIVVLPFLFFDHDSIKSILSSNSALLYLIIAAAILATIADLLIFFGIKILGADTASAIEIAYPFFVVLFSFFAFRAEPNAYFFFGGLLIFVGSVIIIKFA